MPDAFWSCEEEALLREVLLLGHASWQDSPAVNRSHPAVGRVIEDFLSKEVSYIVTSRWEAKPQSCDMSPQNCPSPDEVRAGTPSSTGPDLRPACSVPLSRGKALLQKVIRNQGNSDLLSQARSWGVKILHVDEMMANVQQRFCTKRPTKLEGSYPVAESRTRKVARLQAPFIKVEDESRNFRPCLRLFTSFPELSFLGPKGASPFKTPPTPSSLHQTREPQVSQANPFPGPCMAPQRRKGYCECCQKSFEELHRHLQSDQHQRFAQGAQEYAEVDRIIAQLSPGLTALRNQTHLPRRPSLPALDSRPLDSNTLPCRQPSDFWVTCTPRMEEQEEQPTGAQGGTHLQAPTEPVGARKTPAPGTSFQGTGNQAPWTAGFMGLPGPLVSSSSFSVLFPGSHLAPVGHTQTVWLPICYAQQRPQLLLSYQPPAPVAPGQPMASLSPIPGTSPSPYPTLYTCPTPRPASPYLSLGSPLLGRPSSQLRNPPDLEGSECEAPGPASLSPSPKAAKKGS